MAEREVTDGICVDFSTAFDSVPHDLLIKPKINRPPPHSLEVARGRPALEFALESLSAAQPQPGAPEGGVSRRPRRQGPSLPLGLERHLREVLRGQRGEGSQAPQKGWPGRHCVLGTV